MHMCTLCGSTGKESACTMGELGLIPGLERSSGEGKGYPLQYSGQENSMDCIVHGVTHIHLFSTENHSLLNPCNHRNLFIIFKYEE